MDTASGFQDRKGRCKRYELIHVNIICDGCQPQIGLVLTNVVTQTVISILSPLSSVVGILTDGVYTEIPYPRFRFIGLFSPGVDLPFTVLFSLFKFFLFFLLFLNNSTV